MLSAAPQRPQQSTLVRRGESLRFLLPRFRRTDAARRRLAAGLACLLRVTLVTSAPVDSVVAEPLTISLRPASQLAPAGQGERLVYQNVLGSTKFAFGNGRGGDDLQLTCHGDCLLSRFEFHVRGDAALNLPYSVNFALYDGCPSLGGRTIVGTEGRADIPDGQDYWVVAAPLPQVNIPLPQRIWLAMSFTRPDSGWVGGNPALLGVTDNVYLDFIFGGCALPLGTSFPAGPYSGFNASVFVRLPSEEIFYGYRGGIPEVSLFVAPLGAVFAEDVRLNTDDCRMTAYEVSVRLPGTLQLDVRLPDGGNLPGQILPGSEMSFESTSNALQFARKSFDPPIPIPELVWFTMSPLGGSPRAMVGRPPATVGTTQPTYAVLEAGQWTIRPIPAAFPEAVFSIAVFCEGTGPIGACCDMFQLDAAGDAVCRDIPRINCVYPPRGSSLLPAWQEGALCADDPFDPPCGAAACCRADGVCENVSRNHCFQNAVSWTQGVYCDQLAEPCEFVCIPSLGLCTSPHLEPGCNHPACCRDVCTQFGGDFCCVVEWDALCVQLAEQVCSIPPFNDECAPSGELTGARTIPIPGTAFNTNRWATQQLSDPVFCCHGITPGAQGLGTIWYKFVAPGSTVELNTCRSDAPALDSLLQVFAVGDNSTPQSACSSLIPLACSEDDPTCGERPETSRVCLTDLIPGETYYVMVATKSDETRGRFVIESRTFCTVAPPGPCQCPVGTVDWLSPLDGSLDARRPHPPDDSTDLLGLNQFLVRSPGGSNRVECWAACENPTWEDPNEVAEVITNQQQITSVLLARSIAPGRAQRVEFNDGFGSTSAATFYSHPGNVNDDFAVNSQDILDLLPALDGSTLGAWGFLSSDIDRSGEVTPLDLLDLIDLMNGAEEYEAWANTFRPNPPGFCP